MANYKKGCITRIVLYNFMTYDHVECIPSPYFNIIVGPNGSGKSSLVCGICLGLGGKTSILGRASNLSDYIKHGCDKCRIEIDLFDSNNSTKSIVREIYDNNTSKFWVNTTLQPKKQVDELVKSLGIQMENLCQFLPQDRVTEFTRMNPQDLLVNTQNATGDLQLSKTFEEMVETKAKLKDVEKDIGNESTRLENESARNARMEEELKSFKDRENLTAKIDLLTKKLNWIKLTDSWSKFTKESQSVSALTVDAQKHNQKFMAITSEIQDIKKELQNLQKSAHRKQESFRKQCFSLNDSLRKLQSTNREMELIEHRHTQELEMKNEYDFLLRKVEKELESITMQIKEVPSNFGPDFQRNYESKKNMVYNISTERSKIADSLERLSCEEKAIESEVNAQLNSFNQDKDRIYSKLKCLSKDTYTASCWIKDNAHKFRGKIYDPMMTQIKVTRPEFIKYVEGRISFHDLLSFTCESKEDMCHLSNVLMDQKKLRVNFIHSEVTDKQYLPKIPMKNLKSLGFVAYLKDVILAPPAIMEYLCKNYRIHDVPIGTDETHKISERVIAANILDFYTGTSHFKVGKSVYSGNKFTKVMELRSPSILLHQVTPDHEVTMKDRVAKLESKKEKITSDRELLQSKLHSLDKQLEISRKELNAMNEEKQLKDALQVRLDDKLKQRQRRMEEVEQYSTVFDKKEAQQSLLKNTFSSLRKSAENLLGSAKYMWEIKGIETMINLLNDCYKEKVNLKCGYSDEKDAAEELLKSATKRLREFEALYEDCIRVFQVNCRGCFTISNKGPVLTSIDLKKCFANLPDVLEEIEDSLISFRAQLECLPEVDKRALDEYMRKKKELQALKVKVGNLSKEKEELESKLNQLEGIWIPKITALINNVNANFGNFFQFLNCAGEVSLNIDPDKDYSKCGIVIKVKFRSEDQLRELSSYHQSGGERSVGTMLYMMALQELTQVPFRVLDEINQGMDHINERKVFKLIVETATCSSSQYFLLSPKLLPNLEYGTKCKTHIVYNSRTNACMDKFKWDISAFLARQSG